MTNPFTTKLLATRRAEVFDDGPTQKQKDAFFEALNTATVINKREALIKAKISRAQFERLMKVDADFAARFRAWESSILDRMEERGMQLGMDGDSGMIRMFLQAKRPEVYGRAAKDVGAGGIETPKDLESLSDEDFNELLERLGEEPL